MPFAFVAIVAPSQSSPHPILALACMTVFRSSSAVSWNCPAPLHSGNKKKENASSSRPASGHEPSRASSLPACVFQLPSSSNLLCGAVATPVHPGPDCPNNDKQLSTPSPLRRQGTSFRNSVFSFFFLACDTYWSLSLIKVIVSIFVRFRKGKATRSATSTAVGVDVDC